MIDEDLKETGHVAGSSETPLGESAKSSLSNKLYFLAVSVLFVCAVIHSIASRALQDFILYSISAAMGITLITMQAINNGWREGEYPRRSTMLLVFVCVLFAAFILGAGFYSIGASLKDLMYWLVALWINTPFISGPYRVLVTTLVTFAVGLALFYFRLKLRSVYGFSEAAVGLVVAAHLAQDQALTISNTGFYFALLTAGVYLVVRGLDNVHQGLTIDPIAVTALRFLKRKTRNQGAAVPP